MCPPFIAKAPRALLLCYAATIACSGATTGDPGDTAGAPGDAAIAGDMAVGDSDNGDALFGDTFAGDTAFGDTAFGDTAAGDTAFGDTAAGDTALGDSNTGDTAFGDAATGDSSGTCVDPDLDGYGVGATCLGTDCDETDPSIHQGATEIECDRIDQDCDGSDLRPGNCVLATIDLGATNIENGLTQNEGGDGLTTVVTRASESMRQFDTYIYFGVDDGILFDAAPDQPIEIEIEYFDEGWGLYLVQYDSRNGATIQDQHKISEPELRTDTAQLRTWRFQISDWRFANSQNQSSDFRFQIDSGGSPVTLNRVTILRGGRHRQYVVNVPQDGLERVWGIYNPFIPAATVDYHLGAARLLGGTAAETYVLWRIIEPTEGVYDFSDYDQNLAVMRRMGLRWTPFIIIGPGYSVPTWFATDPTRNAPTRCIEHQTDATDQSLFNPAMWPKVEAGLQAFANHYAPVDADIQSILLGINGTFGESIYTAGGDPDLDGSHDHSGYWAEDALAIASFRSELEARYQTVANLSAAWGTAISAFANVTTFSRTAAPNDRAWWDFVRWYHDAMTRHTEMWLDASRRVFPTQELVLVTGGGAQGFLGSDFDAQAALAAEYNAQIRITNEGSNQRSNLFFTAWLDAATRFYGATCSHEPASMVDDAHIAGRMFNARRAGCFHQHDYFNNMRPPAAAQATIESLDHLRHATPLVETAMLIPRMDWLVNHDTNIMTPESARGGGPLFDRTNVDLVGESMLADGGLASYKYAVLFDGQVWTAPALAALEQWVNSGGILIAATGVLLTTLDLDMSVMTALFGLPLVDQVRDVGLGRTYFFAGSLSGAGLDQYLDDVVATLAAEGSTQIGYDGVDDSVYTAVVEDAVLIFNDSAAPVVRLIDATTVTVPPGRMATVPRSRGDYAQTELARTWTRSVTDGTPQRFVMRNDGALTWTAGTFTLGYHILDAGGAVLTEGRVGAVQTNVPPGASAVFNVPLPNNLLQSVSPGRYRARYDMVHEAVTWFAGGGAQPLLRRLVVTDGTPLPPLDNPDFAAGLSGWRNHGAGWRAPGIAAIHPLSAFEPSWVEQSMHLPASGGSLRARVSILQDDCATSDAVIALFVRVGHTWTKLDEQLVAFANGWVDLIGDLATVNVGPYAAVPGAVRVAARAGGAMPFCSEWAGVDRVWIQ